MRTVVQDSVRLRRFLFVVIALGVLGTLVGVAASNALFGGVTTQELQEKLIDNCEITRSPLRSYFEGEIAATEATAPSLFPDIPPEVFERLIDEKVARLQKLVDTFDPRSCTEQYSD